MWLVYNLPGIVVNLDTRRALKIDLCIRTSCMVLILFIYDNILENKEDARKRNDNTVNILHLARHLIF